MKILFDHQIFTIQKYGGASKYYCELLKRIPRQEWESSTIISNNEYLKNSGLFKYFNFMPDHYFKGKSRLMEEMNMPFSIYKVKQGNYDIFHQTYFTSNYLKAVGKKKMVVTFHDMNHSKFAGLYRGNALWTPGKFEILQKCSVERADMVIAVSENTKMDLVNAWNINPEKIRVIYHGIDSEQLPFLNLERIIPQPYVLFVGERYEYKNFNRFAESFRILTEQYPDIKLVCTGKKFSEMEKRLLSELKIGDKTIQISADEHSMARLYRDATLFAYPSIYEGFGMPVLEAMRYDCPVVLSRSSSLPEVAGDAGTYFDPYQVDDMVEKMRSIISSDTLREQKVALGKIRVNQFSWEKSAKEHLALYHDII